MEHPTDSRLHPNNVRIFILIYAGIFLCVGFALRLHFAESDTCYWRAPNSYISIAANLNSGKGFLDSMSNFGVPDRTRRPPLIPFLMFLMMKGSDTGGGIAAFLVFQSLLGALTSILIGVLGWKVAFSKGVYFFLVPFYSIWGPAMGFAPCVMTETTFIFLFSLASIVILESFRTEKLRLFGLAGLLVGLASLARPVLYPLYFYLAAAWPWLFRRGAQVARKRKILAAAVFFIALLIVIFPWMQRNTNVNGRFTLITSSVGLNLLMHNTPAERPEVWTKLQVEAMQGGQIARVDEQTRDELLFQRALVHIREEPGRFLLNVADRIIHLYNGSNDNSPDHLLPIHWSNKWFFLMVIGLFVLFLTRFPEGLLFAILELNFITVYALTFFEARFRETVIPVHLILACLGGVFLIRKIQVWIRKRRSIRGRA